MDIARRAEDAYGGEDRRTTILAVTWALVGVSYVIVVLRISARAVTRQFGIDDTLIIPALFVQMIYAALLTVAVSKGFGLHFNTLETADATDALHYMTVAQCFSFFLSSSPKPAILALLHRLLGIQPAIRILFWTLSVSLLSFATALSVAWWAQCSPYYRRWDTIGTPGTCWDVSVMLKCAYAFSAFSALLDVVFALLPALVIGRLAMPLYKKIAISLALSGGIVAAGVTVYRITLVPDLGNRGLVDPTWADVPLAIWSSIEACILIVMASLPTIGPVIRLIHEKAVITLHMVTGRSFIETLRPFDSDRKPRITRALWYKPNYGFVSMERRPTRTSGVIDPYATQSHQDEQASKGWTPPTQQIRTAARGDDFARIFDHLNKRDEIREDIVESGIWLGQLEEEPHHINWEIVSV